MWWPSCERVARLVATFREPEAPPPEAPPPLPARVRELSELEAEPQPSSESLFSYAYL